MDKYQAMDDKCGSVLARIAASMSFFTPEIMEADEHQILGYIQEERPGLAQYEFLLKSMLREKEHVLSAPEGETYWLRCQKSPEQQAMYLKCSTTLI